MHAVGVSSQAAGHKALVPALMRALDALQQGAPAGEAGAQAGRGAGRGRIQVTVPPRPRPSPWASPSPTSPPGDRGRRDPAAGLPVAAGRGRGRHLRPRHTHHRGRQVRTIWPAWKCNRHPCVGSHPGTPTLPLRPPGTPRWPAWKCLHHPCVGSHPGTPTLPLRPPGTHHLACLEMPPPPLCWLTSRNANPPSAAARYALSGGRGPFLGPF